MKFIKKAIAFVCAGALLLGALPADSIAASAREDNLVLDKTVCVMKKGDKLKLKATVSLDGLSGGIRWTSSNWKVASVNWKGEVTAKKKGKAVIKVSVGTQKASCKITVGTPVKKIKLPKKTVTLTVGTTTKLNAEAVPKKASVSKLSYAVKNKKIATVSKKGVVRGIKAGTTWVTVSSTDGNNKSAKVKIKVTSKKSTKTQQPVNVTVNPIINVICPTAAPNAAASATPEQDKLVEVTGISLSDTEKSLNLNETVNLTAVVLPENATDQSVTWKSSDTAVATVSKDGLVTPKGEGTAEISASTANGKYTAKCTVTVAPVAIVSTNKEIAEALTLSKLKTLIVKSDTTDKLTVPEGAYSSVDMEVSLPKGELENNGVFKSITVNEIAEDTFFENAIGNVIRILSEKSHIVIGEEADATIVVSEESKETEIENNGNIKKLEILSSGKVDITGTSEKKIAVEISAEVTISTTKRLDINASDHFNITIRPGAESTEITIDAEIHMPGIFGLGMISVKITATGEIKTVVSENNGEDELAEDVLFTGTVRDVEGNGIEGAEITIVPYTDDDELQKDRMVTLTTNAEGEYSTSDKIKSGNYYFTAGKDGYMEVTRQVLVITSVYGDTYTNEEIVLLPADWEGKTGNVTGKILDSETKDLALADIDVCIRKGKNAFDSDFETLKQTKTDEGGIYLFEDLPAGYYTIELNDYKTAEAGGEAYVRTWINVLIRPGETITEGAIMSKRLMDGQLRFILSWGSEDSGAVADLDAHLRGPAGYDGSDYRFHTFFENKNFNNGNEERRSHADLDVDDIDYEGPETTTIYESAPGIYSYYVHDYTNRYEEESEKLAESLVKVEVYSGNVKQNTYYIPQQKGTVWHVFDYDSSKNTFKTVNTMYYEQYSYYVGDTVSEYKQRISSRLTSIEDYQKSLVEGTGDDITEKVAAYQKRMDALTDQQEAEAAALYQEVYSYYQKLYNECRISCSAEGVYRKDFDWHNGKVTLYVNEPDYEPAVDTIQGWNNASVAEVASTETDAWKAFRVTEESGHARVIHVYLEFDISNVNVTNIKAGGNSLSWEGGKTYIDGEQSYSCIYVSPHDEVDFELEDLEFAFSNKAVKIIPDSQKAEREYTVTIQAGSQEKTWVVRKRPIPQLTNSGNKIYKMKFTSDRLDIYADSKLLSDDCVFTVNGKQYELQKEKSGPNHSRYYAYAQEEGISYWIYCYPIDYACTLTSVAFSQNVNAEIDQADSSIVVTANDPDVTAEGLSLNWWNANYSNSDTKAEYKAVTGEDYAGKIIVTLDGVTDYTKEYKVYFKPFEQSAD